MCPKTGIMRRLRGHVVAEKSKSETDQKRDILLKLKARSPTSPVTLSSFLGHWVLEPFFLVFFLAFPRPWLARNTGMPPDLSGLL